MTNKTWLATVFGRPSSCALPWICCFAAWRLKPPQSDCYPQYLLAAARVPCYPECYLIAASCAASVPFSPLAAQQHFLHAAHPCPVQLVLWFPVQQQCLGCPVTQLTISDASMWHACDSTAPTELHREDEKV